MDFYLNTLLPGLLTGAGVTVTVTLASLSIAVVLGFLLALLRQFASLKVMNLAIDVYVEFFRNIPALTHLFILYFGLASIGVTITSIPAAILGLGLIGAAITCDIYRSGFAALGLGQTEAARAVGMTPMQTIRYILSPQAFRIAMPPLGNYALQLMKDTSIVSAIAAPEIMFFARSMVTSSFKTTLIYSSVALIYLAMSIPLAWGVARLEGKLGGNAHV
ncbi:amino acid ABC transporter permease [Aestuariispira ectoiniformans]|uniref:amino acid ABC transporter permease n=1 Tax=Aestuariispira ectoiniformans TaxID=2775080 RepID=UPI00223A7B87|nr:amino acid ABC transporter permease [Aestuariispira ectoiniformans]